MAAPLIREYKKEDIPALKRLWVEVFGDTEGFCDRFFAALTDIGGGVVAECDGVIAGAAYALNGQELVHEGKSRILGYIYGVGVYEKYRSMGLGSKLTKAVCELSKKRGAEIVSTLPAEKPLYAWYEWLIGVKCALYREKIELECVPSETVMTVDSAEYMLRRENYLAGKSHVKLSDCALEFERQLLCEYGGGLYFTESGLCAAYLDGDTAIVREAICRTRTECLRAAASVGAAMGAKKCLLFLPSEKGESYIASDKPLPPRCVWGLSFD